MADNLTREALQQELWNMLPDSCKKIMDCLKETYIESLMADIDSYCQGQKSSTLWVKASDRLAATFLNWLTKDSFLELIAGQWTAKGDEDAKCPFTQERIIELFNESEAKKALEG